MWEREIEEMKNAALLAEKKILEVYHSTFKVETKSDDSPVTEADKAADKIIKDYLKERFPDYAFLTEESVDTKERLHKDLLFIIDPVDGTVEFVNKSGGFSTNIALCYKNEIVAGVINIPLEQMTYYAVKGQGAYKEGRDKNPHRIHVSDRVGKNLRALISISHLIDKEKAQIERHK
ncbi:MAG: 3'(2'),5'-bisphosphate nucleotidase CysQ, partial [Bacilli bacterium]|nr:3'(2'),5'-bisphosphate nucleotidase CysQ [Bacilli bacterium]